jgi:hypothetical protein
MKILLLALLLCLSPVASGTALRIDSVVLPLYLHGSDSDTVIKFERVPFVTFFNASEWCFGAMSKPFIPSTDGTWKPHDVNLVSLYRIEVDGAYKDNNKDMLVKIDASKAVRPEGYPFTIEEVIDAVTTCVKTMSPPKPAEDGTLEITVIRPAKKPAAKK